MKSWRRSRSSSRRRRRRRRKIAREQTSRPTAEEKGPSSLSFERQSGESKAPIVSSQSQTKRRNSRRQTMISVQESPSRDLLSGASKPGTQESVPTRKEKAPERQSQTRGIETQSQIAPGAHPGIQAFKLSALPTKILKHRASKPPSANCLPQRIVSEAHTATSTPQGKVEQANKGLQGTVGGRAREKKEARRARRKGTTGSLHLRAQNRIRCKSWSILRVGQSETILASCKTGARHPSFTNTVP